MRADYCDELTEKCWKDCNYPLVFPFSERCATAPDGGVHRCFVPPTCSCSIPSYMRTNSTLRTYPKISSCTIDTCENYNLQQLSRFRGSLRWCRACGYNCGGFRHDCHRDNQFCRLPGSCSALNMCKKWREAACWSDMYRNETCDALNTPF